MLRLLQLLFLFQLINYGGHITLARKILLERVPEPSVVLAPNSSAISLLQTHNSSQVTPSTAERGPSSHSKIGIPTALPIPFYLKPDEIYNNTQKILANYQDIKSGFCTIGDNFCSFQNSNGTTHDAIATDFSDQCLLWDASCSGNRTMAIETFFNISFSDQMLDDTNTNGNILDNDCFTQDDEINQSYCGIYNPPERLSDFVRIKNWMRSPQCVSAANEWIAMTGNPWSYVFRPGWNQSYADYNASNAYGEELNKFRSGSDYDNSSDVEPSCCGVCSVWAQNVDIYYWPEPEANLSCNSIIGESVRPLDYGATTSATDTYWGCNATYSYSIDGHPGESTTFVELVTTAVITTIGSLAVKMSRHSPWSSVCGEVAAGSQLSNQSTNVLDGHASVYAHSHTLDVPSSVVNMDGLPVSTVVSGDFTL